jgi:hypothetical protein
MQYVPHAMHRYLLPRGTRLGFRFPLPWYSLLYLDVWSEVNDKRSSYVQNYTAPGVSIRICSASVELIGRAARSVSVHSARL